MRARPSSPSRRSLAASPTLRAWCSAADAPQPDDVPEDVKTNKRYAGLDGFTITECAAKVAADYPKIDILVHSLANGPEVTKPLLETSRRGYLAASSASAYSMVSLVQKFGARPRRGRRGAGRGAARRGASLPRRRHGSF